MDYEGVLHTGMSLFLFVSRIVWMNVSLATQIRWKYVLVVNWIKVTEMKINSFFY